MADASADITRSASPARQSIRVVFGYSGFSPEGIEFHASAVERARAMGWDVRPFCLTPNAPARAFTFQELDRLWRFRSPRLARLRRRLAEALRDADVFWNFNGVNVHPSWLRDFRTLNVFSCFDDPESSARLSEPCARFYDAALVGNLACLPLYQSWGLRLVDWAPLGFLGADFDPSLTPEQVLTEDRPIDVVFFGEREMPHRRERLDALAWAFPNAVFHGRGWPGGYVGVEERRRAYRRAKIGWNLHNSAGPVNLRFLTLPASGVMQICDNRCRSGQVFKLGEEIAGFDTIDECIELTRHYLAHDAERRRVAANGLRRYREQYTEERLWEYFFERFERWLDAKRRGEIHSPDWQTEKKKNRLAAAKRRMFFLIERALRPLGIEARRIPMLNRGSSMVASFEAGAAAAPYTERPEAGAANWPEKAKRLEKGEWFEWPNIVALNWAVATMVGGAKRIVEIGGGTGCFAYEAGAEPSRTILCADPDAGAIAWARLNRARPNIEYAARLISPADGPFDLVVAVDVIEHIADYPAFLQTCCALAPRAVLTTPNRRRLPETDHDGPPPYEQHVREWTAGEFYWILRSFYRNVSLHAMPNPYVPIVEPVRVTTELTPLIADCREPIQS